MDKFTRLNWDDLKFLLVLSQCGGAKSAAMALRVSHQTVSRRLAHLEQVLDLRLVNKHRHPWTLTEKGGEICEMAAQMDVAAQNIVQYCDADQTGFTGPVRITSVQWGLKLLVMPALKQLSQTYPKLTFQLIAQDSPVDVQTGRADIAIRFTRRPPPDLIGKRIGALALGVFGVHDMIARLDGAQAGTVPVIKSPFAGPHQKWPPCVQDARETVVVNDFATLVEAAQNGLGVAILPMVVGQQCDTLVASQTIHPATAGAAWLLRNEDSRNSAKIRAIESAILTLGRPLLDSATHT